MKKDSILTLVRRIVVVAVLLVFAVLTFRIGSILRANHQTDEVVKIRTDTLIIRDTVKIEKPVYVTKVVLDSILVAVPVIDTIMMTDTLYIRLQKEQKYYRDKDYEAWVSGYRPELDSLNIFRISSQIETKYQVEKGKGGKVGIGVQIGYGVTFSQTPVFSPYIGVGVSWNFISF